MKVFGANGWESIQDPIPTKFISSTTFYVDSNRTDQYTEEGSIQFPYKTLSAALQQITIGKSYSIVLASGNYVETSSASFPAVPITIYGNGSTL
jgi:hypothetical protein